MTIPLRSKRTNEEAGFSLLELTVALVVLLIITTAIFRSITNGAKTFDAELANAEAQENARYASERLSEIIKTSGNNPQNLTILNNLAFISLYNQPTSGTFNPASPGTPLSIVSGTATGDVVNLLSDFNGDGLTNADVGTGGAASIFSTNIITSENVLLYLDKATNLLMLYNPNASGSAQNVAIAEFVTDLSFTLDATKNNVTINITARSNRAAFIESIYERRFRYANLVSLVRLRNR